jgi:hypothetical protein
MCNGRKYGSWSWTTAEIRLLQEEYPTSKPRELALKLGRPFTAVRQKAYDLGIKTKAYRYWTERELDQLRELYPHTAASEIAKKLKRTKASIIAKLRKLNLTKEIQNGGHENS